MLPPGIFLWESGYEFFVEPAGVDDVVNASPSWAEDMENYGPWGAVISVSGLGVFRKSEAECDSTIVIVRSCPSTMEVARLLVDESVLGDWGAVVAVEQTQGRGQLRRPWVSPPGNLHVSVVMPPAPDEGEWRQAHSKLLPLLSGYVLSEALGTLGAEIMIKWPNDLLQSDRKVGGMLIESKNGTDILGFGLNLVESPPDEMMREDRSVSAGVLQTTMRLSGALTLWGTLVNRGKRVYAVLLGELHPSQFLSAITNRLAWLGHRIQVREGSGSTYYAEITGISQEGGLIIRRAEGEVVLFSGSITPL